MKQPRMIEVRAGVMSDGTPLIVTFPIDIAPAPGAKHRKLTGGETVSVPADHRFVIRSLKNKDLVMVKPESAKVAKGQGKSAPPKPAPSNTEG